MRARGCVANNGQTFNKSKLNSMGDHSRLSTQYSTKSPRDWDKDRNQHPEMEVIEKKKPEDLQQILKEAVYHNIY